jgi:hypothetical protein
MTDRDIIRTLERALDYAIAGLRSWQNYHNSGATDYKAAAHALGMLGIVEHMKASIPQEPPPYPFCRHPITCNDGRCHSDPCCAD